jgi:hypothetical protein
MANGKGGRPRKVAVPKAKKIKLSKAQKQYAKMIRSIEADLAKKQGVIEELGKKLTAITAELARHNGERENLEGAKKNLEGILAQIPPPPAWTNFTKYVYEYHHHYHHHDHAVRPYPVYIGPWWQYYYGGAYITYPSQSQLQLTPLNPSISICDSPNMGTVTGGSFGMKTGNAMQVTTCEALPNSTIVSQSPNSGMFMCHNSNLPLLGTSAVNCSTSSFESRADAPGISFTANVSNGPVEYTKDDAQFEASVSALASYGFFDMGAPLVDAADLSVADIAKFVAK